MENIFDIFIDNNTDNKCIAKEKGDIIRSAYNAKVKSALEIKALGKSTNKLTIPQLKILLAPLKRKECGAIPTKRAVFLEILVLWESREWGLPVDDEVVTVES